MLYKSTEIRWFKKSIDESIIKWFNKENINFQNVESRVDHYLILPGNETLNIKLREGNIEIKQRISQPAEVELNPALKGYLENWEKWSFHIESGNTLLDVIPKNSENRWVEISKTRLGLKYVLNDGSNYILIPISENVPSGCQIEYSRVVLNQETWYSFNLEWFGNESTEPVLRLMHDLMRNSRFVSEDSMSYAGFLNRKVPNRMVK